MGLKLVWCSCGWQLDAPVVDVHPSMPVMVDHWRRGHELRAWSMIRRSVVSAAADYALEVVKGTPRAQCEDRRWWRDKMAKAGRHQ